MKKKFLHLIVLIGLFSGQFSYSVAKNRSWKKRAKEAGIYEMDVWAKGLPAAKKKLWDRMLLTDEEQMYYDALKKRVGIAVVVAFLAGVYGGKKYYDKKQRKYYEAPPLEIEELIKVREIEELLKVRDLLKKEGLGKQEKERLEEKEKELARKVREKEKLEEQKRESILAKLKLELKLEKEREIKEQERAPKSDGTIMDEKVEEMLEHPADQEWVRKKYNELTAVQKAILKKEELNPHGYDEWEKMRDLAPTLRAIMKEGRVKSDE